LICNITWSKIFKFKLVLFQWIKSTHKIKLCRCVQKLFQQIITNIFLSIVFLFYVSIVEILKFSQWSFFSGSVEINKMIYYKIQ
jgi:hypothetical protein